MVAELYDPLRSPEWKGRITRVAVRNNIGAIEVNSLEFCRRNYARLFSFRTLSEGLVGIFLLWVSVQVSAGDLVAESRRYQQVWAPRSVEFVVVNDLTIANANVGTMPSPGFDPATVGPTIRDSLSAYASAVGFPISFVQPGSPCTDGVVTARIVITAPAGELSVVDRTGGTGKFAKMPIRVESVGDCGYRSDAYTRSVAFDVSVPEGRVREDGALNEALARFSRELIDEVLLVWHPAWKVPEPGSNPFSVFALEPISPRASTGFLKGLFSGRGGRGLNGLAVTRIETAQPEFSWTPLEDLLSAPGQPELTSLLSHLTYEFRLYTAAEIGLGLIPGQLLLERTDLTQPKLQLPSPLESCHTYFWTVRARFRLDGFPRITEWMSMHNASGGIVGPWRFRRGERVWNAFDPALTYAAFVTPSSTGKGGCGP